MINFGQNEVGQILEIYCEECEQEYGIPVRYRHRVGCRYSLRRYSAFCRQHESCHPEALVAHDPDVLAAGAMYCRLRREGVAPNDAWMMAKSALEAAKAFH